MLLFPLTYPDALVGIAFMLAGDELVLLKAKRLVGVALAAPTNAAFSTIGVSDTCIASEALDGCVQEADEEGADAECTGAG